MTSMTDNALLQNYGRYEVSFERGEGCRLYDTDGKEYLDFLAGIAVCSLGHSHPALVEAIREQAGRLLHVSNFFYTPQGVAAADAIAAKLGGGRVFFCNSGAEANEAAFKLARKHHWRAGDAGRVDIVALEGSFHGRTFGSLAATIQPAKWEGFQPLPDGFRSIPANDVNALERAIGANTAALVIEAIQGEAGVRPLDDAFVTAARDLTRERGALLICDEVQTGMGRTGAWWGFEHYTVRPDVVTLAKALGGGVPVGAMWVHDDFSKALLPGDHATTFGGGPLVSAAILAVIETIDRDGLVERARSAGERLAAAVAPLGTGVRGRGLLLALELGSPTAGDVAKAALSRGLVVNAVTPSSIRLAPPLVVADDEIDEAASRLASAIEDVT